MFDRRWSPWMAAALTAGSLACATAATAPTGTPSVQASLAAIVPAGGATGVDTMTSITLQFDHAMMPAMQGYMTLHQGDVTGALVGCSAAWSLDSLTLTLTPMSPLHAATTYSMHIGGGMMDARGDSVSLGAHGTGMGGQWAGAAMMNGTGMMGGAGPMAGQEMGPGWAGGNGMYGMVFTFTTR